jgi:hypothetical protein
VRGAARNMAATSLTRRSSAYETSGPIADVLPFRSDTFSEAAQHTYKGHTCQSDSGPEKKPSQKRALRCGCETSGRSSG